MNFWLKPEFGPKVGYGHLSRLAAIAEELESRQHGYCFHYSTKNDLIANQMMKVSGLYLGCKCKFLPEFIIIDSYLASSHDVVSLPKHVTKTLQIVDDVNPKFYADAYIQASPISHWTPSNDSAAILEFVSSPILRKRFDSNEIAKRSNSEQKDKILISLGASSGIEQIISSITIAIKNSRYSNCQVYCLLSGGDLQSLRIFLNGNGIVAIEPGVSVVDIAYEFDFVISACGVTAWEIIVSKIPCLLVGGAENQRNQLNYFISLNISDGLMFENSENFVMSFVKKLHEFPSQKIMREISNGRIRAVNWIENL
jgi:spore coat polysaccharide biosynthesis predicted glycosyltransferase SpsG